MSCIKEVFPGAKVSPNGANSYPARVSVVAQMGKQNMELWSGPQRELFRKYADKVGWSLGADGWTCFLETRKLSTEQLTKLISLFCLSAIVITIQRARSMENIKMAVQDFKEEVLGE